jgi:alkylation response protein AidB-like acyl-CoA dehydrogenase
VNFDLSDDQLLLQSSVHDYFQTRLPLSRIRTLVDCGTDDDEIWRGLMDLGIGAVVAPERYGGLGLGVLDIAAVMEMIGYASAPVPILGQVLGILALAHAGSDDQRERWLVDLATGRRRVGVVFDDTAAVLDAADADVLVVAIDDGLALTEVDDAVTVKRLPSIDKTRTLSDIRLNSESLQPLPGGPEIVEWLRGVALTLLAADAVGGATRCLDMTVDYVKVREQGGVVVGSYQAVKHQLAEVALRVDPARGLYWYAAYLLDQDGPIIGTEAARAAALAKAHTTERFVEAGREAVKLHGGFGYTWECAVHIFLKRALIDRQYLGDPRQLYARVADLSGW